jgi:hypothetical protein
MATKTGLTTAIANAITVLITRAKLLSGLTEIVNEIYPDVVSDSGISETYTTKAGSTIAYGIRLTKAGRLCNLRGEFQNSTTSTQGSQNIFTWKNNQFKPRAENFRGQAIGINGTNGTIQVFMNGNVLATVGNMAPDGEYYFSLTYSTLD